jgi:hypothetical protein
MDGKLIMTIIKTIRYFPYEFEKTFTGTSAILVKIIQSGRNVN